VVAANLSLTPAQSREVRELAWRYGQLFEQRTLPQLAREAQAGLGSALFGLWLEPAWSALSARPGLGGQRTVLIRSASPAVLNLPWELLHPGGEPLGSDARWALRRMPIIEGAVESGPAVSELPPGPLRVLLMVAAPQDQPELDFEREEELLLRALGRDGRDVVIDIQQYGLRKFIVVVPSVAVREGVKKTLDVTKKHLDGLYGKPPYRYSVYDSANHSQVRAFALSDGLEIMVMTIDAFKRGETVIRQSREVQDPPIHWLQAVRPVLILDEPQNMESELSVAALAALNPLFALRYSATHRNPYNVVYRLTPYDAYRQGLVKRIEVASVMQEDNANRPFIRLDEVKTKKRTLTAIVAVHKLMKSGKIAETSITIKPEDDLAGKTGRPEYQGFVVEEINFGSGYVRFANNVEIRKGETKGAEKEAIFEAQIKFTIEEHFRKAARYRERGIKVLSLFFIDKVENFASRHQAPQAPHAETGVQGALGAHPA